MDWKFSKKSSSGVLSEKLDMCFYQFIVVQQIQIDIFIYLPANNFNSVNKGFYENKQTTAKHHFLSQLINLDKIKDNYSLTLSCKSIYNNNSMEADKQIYTVLKWNAVASWVSDSVTLNCSICRESLGAACPHCLLLSDPSITCQVAKGQCGHSFHKHCLDRWFSSQRNQNCLLCSATWNPV